MPTRYRIAGRGSYGHKTGMKIVLQGDHRLLISDVILLSPQTHPEAKQAPMASRTGSPLPKGKCVAAYVNAVVVPSGSRSEI
jgi:hypothetical protein